ncbi:MAG: 2-C-methyl-D-erythritol 4-phosphate cytidylyltransferase [Phycisphaerae bacterium]|nr:2-C-methyl-D-erythritol 4-phosphate cytidylyltransferase [Phycisphaerae bacterium]
MTKTAVLIAAAGSGTRFGGKTPKQFADIDGRAVFLRTIEKFADREDVAQIILAIPADQQEIFEIRHSAKLVFFGVKTVFGGTERHGTIENMLKEVNPDIDLIAIHDAARPCITKEQIDAVFVAAIETGAAILASPLVGTIKKVDNEHNIVGTVDRSKLWQAQTPQVFKAEIIRKAYENIANITEPITDDAQLAESLNIAVKVVPSDETNIKITNQVDLAIAAAILKSQAPKPKRGGNPFQADKMW